MKTLITALLSLFFIAFTTVCLAQTKKEIFTVSGECGTCKKKIEASAKKGGASFASWNIDSKLLTVKYNSTATNKARIEKAIAATGYDTPDVKATTAAYNGLDDCCQYERSSAAPQNCCDDERCTHTACMKDGKCSNNMACCKEAGCTTKDCCKKS